MIKCYKIPNSKFDDDFGSICICAERYALGRQSYMPKLVIDYITLHIIEIDTRALNVMITDIKEAEKSEHKYALGDPNIDRPAWIAFRELLENVIKGRENDDRRL